MRVRHLRRVMAFAGAVALLSSLALPAVGQSLSGGCDATVSGRSPESMTKSDPLLIDPDIPIAVTGSVPAAGLALPDNQATSELDIYLYTFGVPVPVDNRSETGHSWGGTVDVPSWLSSLASGLYKVEAKATGNPGWACQADGYVKLGDSGFTAAAAVGAVVLAAGVGAAVTSAKPVGGGPRPETPSDIDPNAPPGVTPKDPPEQQGRLGGKQGRPLGGAGIDTSAALQANLGLLLGLLLLFVAALVGLGT